MKVFYVPKGKTVMGNVNHSVTKFAVSLFYFSGERGFVWLGGNRELAREKRSFVYLSVGID